MYEQILKRGKEKKKQLADSFKRAARKKGVEKMLPPLHDAAFKEIDCLQCAGCCKHISPRFKTPDVKRIAKFLGLKESVFIATYLHLDEDGDYVVRQHPCPFLGAHNYCTIYEVRPGDCRKYPYTDSGDFFAYPRTTVQNIDYCPAVVKVLEALAASIK